MAFSRHPFIASKPRRAHHGVRVRLPGQRCWYGSLLTHSVRRGVFFAVWRPVLDSRDTDSIPQGLTPLPKRGGGMSHPPRMVGLDYAPPPLLGSVLVGGASMA